MYHIHHYINGKTVEGQSGRFGDIYNPTIGEVQGKVALASKAEVEAAGTRRSGPSAAAPTST